MPSRSKARTVAAIILSRLADTSKHGNFKMQQYHTPGPWKVTSAGFDSSCDENDACYYIAANNGMQVSKANANLIEAAPDLLDALERLVAHSEIANIDCRFALDAIEKAYGVKQAA